MRIVVVALDDRRGRKLAAALAGLAPVIELANAPQPDAQLTVIDVQDLASLAQTTGPVIAVLASADIGGIVDALQAAPNVAAVYVMTDLDAGELRPLAARIIADDVFGLDKVVGAGSHLHTYRIATYDDKVACLAAIAAHIEVLGIARAYEPIEQSIDELVMNALYDAAVDARGKRAFEGVGIRKRIAMRTQHEVIVQFASDDKRFAIAARDVFGSLQRSTVIRHLYKGVHARDAVDRRVEGAGLGLYLMASAAEGVFFNVLPGIATEVICAFELGARKRELAQIAFLEQRDPRGLVASSPARPRYTKPRYKLWAAVGGAVLVAAAAALIVPRLLATTPPPPRVELATTPVGAMVQIDGKPMGTTPLALTSLPAGKTVAIAFAKPGFDTATAQLAVPAAGGVQHLEQALSRTPGLVRMRLVSTPAGARIAAPDRLASPDHTYTPAEVFVEIGKPQKFYLTMPQHAPVEVALTPAATDEGHDHVVTLEPIAKP